MQTMTVLKIFIVLYTLQYALTRYLASINRSFYLDSTNQKNSLESLNINHADLKSSIAYAEDKYNFGRLSSWFSFVFLIVFIWIGGFGWLEGIAKSSAGGFGGEVATGLFFFLFLYLGQMLMQLPFDYYQTFVLEEKHGFNKSTLPIFFTDRLKGLLIALPLAGLFFGVLLWIMGEMGTNWWAYAWAAVFGFMVLTTWLFPTLISPLFNKFKPLPEGELKESIDELSGKVGFENSGVSIMNASMRSSHGNAYFTGIFGKKRIVLFDTLVDSLLPKEIVSVLAHELGHFKLKHVRNNLIQSFVMTGLMLFIMSKCLPLEVFYKAFGFDAVSNYGALVVFSLWWGLVQFLLTPVFTLLSRKNEFAADKFAYEHVGTSDNLINALKKLRSENKAVPLSHPWYSSFYFSHPPIIERLAALKALENNNA